MCLKIEKIHHFAIICSDYEKSKYFYTKVLPFSIIAEHYREERQSFKLDLSLNGNYILELFSFPTPAKRPSYPEACGGRHLCLGVSDIKETISFNPEGCLTEYTRDVTSRQPQSLIISHESLVRE